MPLSLLEVSTPDIHRSPTSLRLLAWPRLVDPRDQFTGSGQLLVDASSELFVYGVFYEYGNVLGYSRVTVACDFSVDGVGDFAEVNAVVVFLAELTGDLQ